jgi:hypothetical protein
MISQQRICVKIWKKIVATSSYGKEWATYLKKIYLLVLAENEIKYHLINLTHGCSDLVDGYAKVMFLFSFLVWYSTWRHYFAVAADTITSCSLGRQYRPVFSLSFLDVYDVFLGPQIQFL